VCYFVLITIYDIYTKENYIFSAQTFLCSFYRLLLSKVEVYIKSLL